MEASDTRSTCPKPERLQRVFVVVRKSLDRVERVAMSGYIEIGRILVRIKTRTPHGAFLSLFTGSANAIDTPIPMTAKKGQALMRAALDPVLGNPRNWHRLSTDSWRTMDTLTRLAKFEPLEPLMTAGLLHRRTSKRWAEERLAQHGGARGSESERALPAGSRDPLAEILTAIRLYTGDPPTLIAFLREQADDLEAELPEMDATAEVEAGRPR